MPYDLVLGNKTRGKEEEGALGVVVFVFPSNGYMVKPCFAGNG